MIQVENLCRDFGLTHAVSGLNFSVKRGEIVGFLGQNGAGKSTTMRMITGSLAPTSGRVRIDGVDVWEAPASIKGQIGYLPEVPPLYTEMTVRGYLRYCAELKRVSSVNEAVEQVIGRVGLSDVAHRLIEHLSKGFRQRVGLAQALVHSPKLLILDEPASGLDPAQRVEIRELVRELSHGDTTVLLSTHVLSEVEALCDRVIIIHKGQIVAQDSLEHLQERQHGVQLRVAEHSDALTQALQSLAGVRSVQSTDDGRYTIIADRETRAEVATLAVPFGLLELGQGHRLEDAFLQITKGVEQ